MSALFLLSCQASQCLFYSSYSCCTPPTHCIHTTVNYLPLLILFSFLFPLSLLFLHSLWTPLLSSSSFQCPPLTHLSFFSNWGANQLLSVVVCSVNWAEGGPCQFWLLALFCMSQNYIISRVQSQWKHLQQYLNKPSIQCLHIFDQLSTQLLRAVTSRIYSLTPAWQKKRDDMPAVNNLSQRAFSYLISRFS